MNRFAKALGRVVMAFPFVGARARHQMYEWNWLPGDRIRERNYEQLVGDGGMNSIVSATVMWIARTFPEAPPAMWDVDLDHAVRQRIARHPVVRLLKFPTATPDKPGGYYSGVHLWMATIVSWLLDGNAYWLKGRSGLGRVVQLWYVPHWMMEPRWDPNGKEYIGWYDLRVNGVTTPIDPSDVVHFRYGLDPDNTRKGIAPLRSVLREIFTDDEAARFSASVLKNLGVPGVIISPAKGAPVPRTNQTDLDGIKTKFRETFTGDNRGDAMVLGSPTDVMQFQFSMGGLDLSVIRDVAEERVTAALGVPAAVVGFGTGLQTTKVGAVMGELREQAWQSNLIPTQRIIGADIQAQLVPDFETDLETKEFGFDHSQVKVLQDSQKLKADIWAVLVEKKIAKRAEARAAFDLPIDEAVDDVYIDATASSTSGLPAGQQPPALPAPLAAPPAPTPAEPAAKAALQAMGELLGKAMERMAPTPIPLIPEGAINVTNNITVPERSVDVHAPVTVNVPERPVKIDVHNEDRGAENVEIIRNDNGQVVGARKAS